MRPSFVAVIAAIIVATIIVFIGPTVSWLANAHNIVGDRESAATYASSSVAFLGTILGASAAFIAYEWQRGDHRATRARACAILVKTAMRPALQEMFELFTLGLRAISKPDREALIREGLSADYKVKPEFETAAKLFMDRWTSISTTLDIDAQTADALAHLDSDYLQLLLRAHMFWRREVGDTDGIERFATVIEWVELALDASLELNTGLNKMLFGAEADSVITKSTDAWLIYDEAPWPL